MDRTPVETRVPFLDPDVVALALNLPIEHRVGRERKSLLRAVGVRHLPEEVAARPKQVGLRANANRWLRRHARPGFLEDGRLRDVLGVAAEPWRAMVRRTIQRPGARRVDRRDLVPIGAGGKPGAHGRGRAVAVSNCGRPRPYPAASSSSQTS